MGVLSPSFEAVNTPKAGRAPTKARVNAEPVAPSISLPIRFVTAGMLAFFTGLIFLVLRPDILATYHYNQYVVAVTHLFTLGWITSTIMGAMYQLVPVALETKLHSERLGKWQFALHAVGVAGMVWMFWVWDLKQVGHFGSVVGLGIGLFVYNIGRTLARVKQWNVIAVSIAASLFWLTMAMVAGLYVVCDKCWFFNWFDPIAQMHAHAHLGAVGFFVTMIVGVSYKLVPMFALSEVRNQRRAWWSIALLNAGLLGLLATILLASPWKLAFALVIISGLAVFGVEIMAILRARKRRKLDWGLTYFITGLSLLAPLSVIGIILCWPNLPATLFTTQLENVYGFLGLLGVVTLAILGMLYKIVPFLVWYGRYSKEIGRSKVPALADLYSTRLQEVGYWLYAAGLLAVSVTALLGNERAVQWSCALLAGSILVFAVNMGKIFAHLIRPKVHPLVFQPLMARSQ